MATRIPEYTLASYRWALFLPQPGRFSNVLRFVETYGEFGILAKTFGIHLLLSG
jgi:hypothetical protein